MKKIKHFICSFTVHHSLQAQIGEREQDLGSTWDRVGEALPTSQQNFIKSCAFSSSFEIIVIIVNICIWVKRHKQFKTIFANVGWSYLLIYISNWLFFWMQSAHRNNKNLLKQWICKTWYWEACYCRSRSRSSINLIFVWFYRQKYVLQLVNNFGNSYMYTTN